MSTFAQELERCRIEIVEAQAAAREREENTPLSSILDEFRSRRQQENTDGQERRRAMWGRPPLGSSFGRGEAGRSVAYRNGRLR